MPSIKERLEQTLEHVKQIGAEPVELALTEADYQELGRLEGGPPRGVGETGLTPTKGQIGGMSYIRARKPDGSVSDFGF